MPPATRMLHARQLLPGSGDPAGFAPRLPGRCSRPWGSSGAIQRVSRRLPAKQEALFASGTAFFSSLKAAGLILSDIVSTGGPSLSTYLAPTDLTVQVLSCNGGLHLTTWTQLEATRPPGHNTRGRPPAPLIPRGYTPMGMKI